MKFTEGSSVGPARSVALIRGITSESRHERRIWADVAGEWDFVGELDNHEVRTIAVVLAWAVLLETDKFHIRAGLLDSLDSLAQKDITPLYALEQVTSGLSREDLDVAEVDSYDTLVRILREQRGQAGSRRVSVRKAVGPARCLQLLRGMTSESSQQRHAWAAVAGEWDAVGELDDHEASTIATVLGWAALLETETLDIRKGFLCSLGSLARKDLVPASALELVISGIARQDLDVAEMDAYDTLVDIVEQRSRADPTAPGSTAEPDHDVDQP